MVEVHVQGRKQDFPQDIMVGDISGLPFVKYINYIGVDWFVSFFNEIVSKACKI